MRYPSCKNELTSQRSHKQTQVVSLNEVAIVLPREDTKTITIIIIVADHIVEIVEETDVQEDEPVLILIEVVIIVITTELMSNLSRKQLITATAEIEEMLNAEVGKDIIRIVEQEILLQISQFATNATDEDTGNLNVPMNMEPI